MAMKESNKDRARRLAKEEEKANRLFALNEMATNAEELGLDYDTKPTSGVEGWVSQDSIPYQAIEARHVKWVIGAVVVTIVVLLVL